MSLDRDALVAALEAERLRPIPPRPNRPQPPIDPDALAELLDEVAGPPTRQQVAAAERMEDYVFLRDANETRDAAAARVGIRPKTARVTYEPHYRRGNS